MATMETTDSSIYIRLKRMYPCACRPSSPGKGVALYHSVLFKIYFAANSSFTQRVRISDSDRDRPLIDALIADEKLEHPRRRFACTGRFLTMHKRRRKKLTTRSLSQDSAILDDIHHGQVQCILNQVGNWKFNAFTLETVTGGE